MFGSDAMKLSDSIEMQNVTKIFPGFALHVIFYSCQLNRCNLKVFLVTLGDKSIDPIIFKAWLLPQFLEAQLQYFHIIPSFTFFICYKVKIAKAEWKFSVKQTSCSHCKNHIPPISVFKLLDIELHVCHFELKSKLIHWFEHMYG